MEYTATHLKRQLIHFMALRADVFAKYCNDHILFEYSNPQLNKNFSFKDYLLYMHQDHSWGDACILNARTRVSECYNFMEEDPDVYSDLEEPWKHEGYEEFATDKNTKGPGGAVRTVVKEVEKEVVKVVEVEVPGEQGGEQ